MSCLRLQFAQALCLAVVFAAGCRGPAGGAPNGSPDVASEASTEREVRRQAGQLLIQEGQLLLVLSDQLSLDWEQLLEVVEEDLQPLRLGEGSKANADDAAYLLEEHYRENGYASALVEYEYSSEGKAARVTLNVEEGGQLFLGDLRFTGNQNFDSEELKRAFPPESSWWSREDPIFAEAAVKSAIRSIESFYKSQGFADVQCAEPQYERKAERVDVRIQITDGPRYRIAELRGWRELLQLAGGSTAEEREALTANLLGEPFVPGMDLKWNARAVGLLRQRGYVDADVQVTSERGDTETSAALSEVPVVLEMACELGDQVRIAKVLVESKGKRLAQPTVEFIRARIPLQGGDLADSERVRKGFLDLYRSGLFKEVDLALIGEGAERDLLVSVLERPSLEVYVQPGFGSYELARLAVGLTERNLLGRGRALRLDAIAAVRAQKAIASLTDPWFLDSEYSMTYSLFFSRRENPSFTNNVLGAGATLARDWNERWSSSLGYQFRSNRLSDVEADGLLGDELEDSNTSSLTLTVTRDTRDGILLPTQGMLSRASLEWSSELLGSELDYMRWSWVQSAFFPLREGTTWGLSQKGGVIVPLAGTDTIPLQERFFNGGENSVRSFRADELGPLDSGGDPLGGEAFHVFSTELRQRLAGRLEGAAFVDLGNVAVDYSDWLKFDDLEWGVGVGLRYLLPIGPIRLDTGWNPDADDDQDDFVVHFSVGLSF